MIKVIKKATDHFLEFHKGIVNIACHIIGFAVLFYSLYKLNWFLFAISLLLLETGHVYNHFAGIKAYDLSPKVNAWRIILFLLLVGSFFLITLIIK